VLALDRKHALPTELYPGAGHKVVFPYWHAVIASVWGLALVVLIVKAVRVWPQARAWLARRRTEPSR
jgi:hypothetical protein